MKKKNNRRVKYAWTVTRKKTVRERRNVEKTRKKSENSIYKKPVVEPKLKNTVVGNGNQTKWQTKERGRYKEDEKYSLKGQYSDFHHI
jgi:hypothetical protein